MNPRNTPFGKYHTVNAYVTRLETLCQLLSEDLDWVKNYALVKAQANNKLLPLLEFCLELRVKAYAYKLETQSQREDSPNQLLVYSVKHWNTLDGIYRSLNAIIEDLLIKLDRAKENQMYLYNLNAVANTYLSDLSDIVKNHILFRGGNYSDIGVECGKLMTQDDSLFYLRANLGKALFEAARYDFLRTNFTYGLLGVEEQLKCIDEQIQKRGQAGSSSTPSTAFIAQAITAQASRPVDEKKEAFLAEADARFEYNRFIEIKRLRLDPSRKIRKLLIIDLDNTVARADVFSPNIEFFHLDEWIKIGRQLPDDCLAILLTSRVFPDINIQSAEYIIAELEKLVGKPFIHSFLYTCGERKVAALKELFRRFLAFEPDTHTADLGLIDDSFKSHITDARKAGFKGFLAEEQNKQCMTEIAEFIKSHASSPKLESNNQDEWMCNEVLETSMSFSNT